MRLVSLLRSTTVRTAKDLMVIVQGLEELDECYTPMMRKARKEAAWPSQAVPRYGRDMVSGLQRNAGETTRYNARCKRACILADWIEGVPTQDIERTYTISPFVSVGYGDIRSIADTTRFHLRSASEIASLLLIDEAPSEDAVESLLQQLELGIPEDALELLKVPVGFTRGEYLALRQREVKSAETLWQLEEKELKTLLGELRASEVLEAKKESGVA